MIQKIPTYNSYTAPTKRKKKELVPITVVILAASPGYRMKSYGPKGLLPLDNGATIISRIIDNINLNFDSFQLVVSVGFQADKLIRALPENVVIVENQLFEITNIIEECRLTINAAVNSHILFIHGDLIFGRETLTNVMRNGSSILIDNDNNMDEDSIGVTVCNNRATTLHYGLPTKWTYISYLEGRELDLFSQFCNNREHNKMFFFEGLNYVLDNGGNIEAIEQKGKISRIESSRDIV